MKKMLLVLMMVVLTSMSFAARGDKGESGGDFYGLYNSAYEAAGTPSMHSSVDMKSDSASEVMAILNKGWYECKMLELEKLESVFAIDKLLVDGPSSANKAEVKKHMEKIRAIGEKITKVHDQTKAELNKHMNVDKLK